MRRCAIALSMSYMACEVNGRGRGLGLEGCGMVRKCGLVKMLEMQMQVMQRNGKCTTC